MNAKKVKAIRKKLPLWREASYQQESNLNWKTLELVPGCGRYMYKLLKRYPHMDEMTMIPRKQEVAHG